VTLSYLPAAVEKSCLIQRVMPSFTPKGQTGQTQKNKMGTTVTLFNLLVIFAVAKGGVEKLCCPSRIERFSSNINSYLLVYRKSQVFSDSSLWSQATINENKFRYDRKEVNTAFTADKSIRDKTSHFELSASLSMEFMGKVHNLLYKNNYHHRIIIWEN
jgi:hypothetical protein